MSSLLFCSIKIMSKKSSFCVKAKSAFAKAAEKNLAQHHQDNGLRAFLSVPFQHRAPSHPTASVSDCAKIAERKESDLVEEKHHEDQKCHDHLRFGISLTWQNTGIRTEPFPSHAGTPSGRPA